MGNKNDIARLGGGWQAKAKRNICAYKAKTLLLKIFVQRHKNYFSRYGFH
jgi:hypothetical protein